MSAATAQTTLEANKALIARWFEEVWNQGRRETIGELFAADGILYDGSATLRGPADFYRFHDEIRAQFSKFSIRPVVALAENDLVCLRWSADFVQTATGRPMHVTGTSTARVRNGQFVEVWQNWDNAGLAAQVARA